MSRKATDRRNKHIAAIHAAARELELDEDSYRALLERVSATGGATRRSAKEMTLPQLTAVLTELNRLGGFKPSPKAKGKPANFERLPDLIAKVEALLAHMKLPWSYADSIAKRQFGIQRMAWCRTRDQLRSVIAALDAEREKRELFGYVERTCKRVGISLEQLEVRYGLGGIRGWRRNRKTLKVIGKTLASEFPERENGEA